jgi:hypothetical protein
MFDLNDNNLRTATLGTNDQHWLSPKDKDPLPPHSEHTFITLKVTQR